MVSTRQQLLQWTSSFYWWFKQVFWQFILNPGHISSCRPYRLFLRKADMLIPSCQLITLWIRVWCLNLVPWINNKNFTYTFSWPSFIWKNILVCFIYQLIHALFACTVDWLGQLWANSSRMTILLLFLPILSVECKECHLIQQGECPVAEWRLPGFSGRCISPVECQVTGVVMCCVVIIYFSVWVNWHRAWPLFHLHWLILLLGAEVSP